MLLSVSEALKHMSDAVMADLHIQWIEERALNWVVTEQMKDLSEQLGDKINVKADESQLHEIPVTLLRDDQWLANISQRLTELRKRAREAREAEGLAPEDGDTDGREMATAIADLRRQMHVFGDDQNEMMEGLREVRRSIQRNKTVDWPHTREFAHGMHGVRR